MKIFKDEERNERGKLISEKEKKIVKRYNNNLKYSIVVSVILVILPFILSMILFLLSGFYSYNWYLASASIIFFLVAFIWLISRWGMFSFMVLSMKNRVDKKQMKMNDKEDEFVKMEHSEFLENKKMFSKLPIYITMSFNAVVFLITISITYL